VIAVKGQFVSNINEDQNTASQTHGQSGDVDKRIAFVTKDVSDGDLEVVL
jgi:hypothetical protein